MISREALRTVLLDYRRVVEQQKVLRRQVEIGDFPRCVLVGIRRAGKSFLLYQKAQALLAQGKTWDDKL